MQFYVLEYCSVIFPLIIMGQLWNVNGQNVTFLFSVSR